MDVVTRGREFLASMSGRRVTIVGLAKSGVAAAQLLHAADARVVATDAKPLDALSADALALQALGVKLMAGKPAHLPFVGADLVVVSPGVPLDGEQLAPAREMSIPIIGELELGWRATEADTIAVTGTNGKTTTTVLTGALLSDQSRPVLVAGNIGTPIAAEAQHFAPDGWLVAEVSSFQLETIEHFRPRVAAILNITPDHLDRHHTFEAYLAAKARLLENQEAGDCAVLNADDDATRSLARRVRGEVVFFSRRRPVDRGIFVLNGVITSRLGGANQPICPVSEITLRGAHNVENVLAATACALWTGVEPDAIRRGIARFRAVPHRLEFVRNLRGVQYYNDSKGTNVESTIKALESFTERIVLIAGGKGKGQDFAPLAAAARGRVRRAILIGQDAPTIAAALEAARIGVTRSASLPGALAAARAAAMPGDVVLLSPACASFDMFENFEQRGDVFKSLVRALD